MLMNNTIKVTLYITFAIFLFACGNNANKGGAKIDYQTGFPQDTSPALTDYMTDYFMQRSNLLFKIAENEYVFAERNGSYKDETIDYFTFNMEEIEHFYVPVQTDDEPDQVLDQLYHQVEDIKQSVQSNLSLPNITCLNNNTLLVVSGDKERKFPLPELEESIKEDDQLICNLSRINDEGFIMQIDKRSTKDTFYFFVLHDLSKAAIFEQKDLEQAVNQGEISTFYSILKNEESDRYGQLLYNSFVDTEVNELLYIEEKHEISRDGKYIYLNGAINPLDEDTQLIQRVEDYLSGNDEVYSEFHLNYKDIAKHVDFKASGNVSIGSVVYFSEDFIVLFINYSAPITGKAGSTNVLIDLQDKENPTFYVVELGIR